MRPDGILKLGVFLSLCTVFLKTVGEDAMHRDIVRKNAFCCVCHPIYTRVCPFVVLVVLAFLRARSKRRDLRSAVQVFALWFNRF